MTNRKNDVKFHEVLKQASIYVYGKKTLPTGYKVIDKAENKENGFYAEAISNGKDVIVVYRGSDELKDYTKNNVDMAHSQLPSQCIDAVRFHDKVAGENKNAEITVTGHSLGGSNAEITSAIRGTTAVTFNAYGVRDMFTSYTRLKEDNIVNYVNEMDGITMVNGHNHLGDIYSVPNVAEPSRISAYYKWNCHKSEGMGSLSERVRKTPEEIKETAERLHPNGINFKDNINKGLETWDRAIDFKNDIQYEATKVKNIVVDSVKKAKQNIHDKVSQCVGSYSVSGYTRDDGTVVEGYVRKCDAKHNN